MYSWRLHVLSIHCSAPLLGSVVGGYHSCRIKQYFLMDTPFPPLPDRSLKRGRTEVTPDFLAPHMDNFPRYHVIHSEDTEKPARGISPFLVAKCLEQTLGLGHKVTKMASGDLLLEIFSKAQHDKLSSIETFGETPVTITEHKSMNTVRGVVSDDDLIALTEAELLDGWKKQNVIDVKRIKIRRDDKEISTKHLILTFGSSRLPEHIETGYMKIRVRAYIPNPRRCFRCQKYGHGSLSCRGRPTCAKCAEHDHSADDCNNTPHCANCDGGHASYSRSCPAWKKEKEIIALKIKENISFKEARKRFSIVQYTTYSDVTRQGPVPQQILATAQTPHRGSAVLQPAPTAGAAVAALPSTKGQRPNSPAAQAAPPREVRSQLRPTSRISRRSSASQEAMDTTVATSTPLVSKDRRSSLERAAKEKQRVKAPEKGP